MENTSLRSPCRVISGTECYVAGFISGVTSAVETILDFDRICMGHQLLRPSVVDFPL